MEEQLNNLYNRIANHLFSMIPVEWDRIYMLGEVKKEQLSYSVTFYYIETETKKIVNCLDIPENYCVSEEVYDELHFILSEMVYELNDCFKNNGQELWEQVVFVFDKNGNFTIDFKY